MNEEKKEKIKDFRARLDEMNETLKELEIGDKELEKEMREKFRACFIH